MNVKDVTVVDNAKRLLASGFMNFPLFSGVAATFLTLVFLMVYCNTI